MKHPDRTAQNARSRGECLGADHDLDVNTRTGTQRAFGLDERAAWTEIHDSHAAPGAERCLHARADHADARIATTVGHLLSHA
jgi:hypothetical protein